LTEIESQPAAAGDTPAEPPAAKAPAEAPAAGQAEARQAAERPAAARRSGKREYRGRYGQRRKVCAFCADKIAVVDYKDVARLRRYLGERAKIEPRRKTGTCARHQRALATAIKRARHVALLPFTGEHMRISGMTLR
jgi:small subunit ribosomal protein S18